MKFFKAFGGCQIVWNQIFYPCTKFNWETLTTVCLPGKFLSWNKTSYPLFPYRKNWKNLLNKILTMLIFSCLLVLFFINIGLVTKIIKIVCKIFGQSILEFFHWVFECCTDVCTKEYMTIMNLHMYRHTFWKGSLSIAMVFCA